MERSISNSTTPAFVLTPQTDPCAEENDYEREARISDPSTLEPPGFTLVALDWQQTMEH